MTEDEWINTPFDHETECERDFLDRLILVCANTTVRASSRIQEIERLIVDRLNPEFARFNRSLTVHPWEHM